MNGQVVHVSNSCTSHQYWYCYNNNCSEKHIRMNKNTFRADGCPRISVMIQLWFPDVIDYLYLCNVMKMLLHQEARAARPKHHVWDHGGIKLNDYPRIFQRRVDIWLMVLMSPNFSDFWIILPWLLIRICFLVVLAVTSNVCFPQLFPICWLLYRIWFPVVWFLEAVPQLLHHRLSHASLCAWFYIPTKEAGLLGVPMNTPVYKAGFLLK